MTVQWRPFLLGPIFKSFGWSTSPFVLQTWKTAFPRATVLPARVALIGAEKPWMSEYCRRIMQLNFVSDQDINSVACVSEVLTQLGLRAPDVIDEAQADANKLHLRNQTDAAKAKGIFGAPTFFVGEEMFWGNDRLDDALAYASASKAPVGRIL